MLPKPRGSSVPVQPSTQEASTATVPSLMRWSCAPSELPFSGSKLPQMMQLVKTMSSRPPLAVTSTPPASLPEALLAMVQLVKVLLRTVSMLTAPPRKCAWLPAIRQLT
jgi:hypothetical protein